MKLKVFAYIKKPVFTIILILTQVISVSGQNDLFNLVPEPFALTPKTGFFNLNTDTRIVTSADLSDEADYFCHTILPATGLKLSVSNSGKGSNVIRLKKNSRLKSKYGTECYRLVVEDQRILLEAGGSPGIFYGLQTLLQLLPSEVFSRSLIKDIKWDIPCTEILDHPRFEWRGFMLDASRHFQPVDYVKHTLDLMAMHKMNVFHWHLTDDHGWRIEIKKYPWLTEKGAWRNQPNFPVPGERETYGGYYTQEQVREIIDYAAERHIEIIPEIELPGHAAALIYSMPELACSNAELSGYVRYFKDYPQYEKKYIRHPGSNVVCAGKESAYRVIDDILSEIVALFPSEFIHIGGDEVEKIWWDKCPQCKKRMKEENLESMDELQAYFINRLEKMLISKEENLLDGTRSLKEIYLKQLP